MNTKKHAFAGKFTVLIALTFAALATRATTPTNYWDPQGVGTGTNGSDGSGTWDSGATWWNGTNDAVWTANDVAYIGSGTPGAYNITLNNAVSASITSVNTSGYTFSGASLTNTNSLVVSANVNVTFNNHVYLASGAGITIGNGGTLTLTGGLNSLGGSDTFNGNTTGILAIPSGTVTLSGAYIMHTIINQTGGALTSGEFFVGYGGPGTWNLSGGTASIGSELYISRGSTGILNLSGGTMATTSGVNVYMATIDATDNGTVNMSGGNFNVGIGTAGTAGLTSSSLGTVIFMGDARGLVYSASAQGIFNMSSGTLAAKGFQFGNSNNYASNPKCQFNLTGGTVYLDSIGISNAALATSPFTSAVLNLQGGTIAATTNWTGRMPMVLGTTNGNVTFQAGDVNGNAHNITLTNVLSGPGGLNVSGNGILTLSGADTFAGSSSVYSGTLAVSTAASASIGPVTVYGGTLSTVLSGAGQSWANAGLDLNPGTTADFNFGSVPPSTSQPLIQVNGNLTLDSSDIITVESSSFVPGTYPLMTASGTVTLTGSTNLPVVALTNGEFASLSQNGNTINLVIGGQITSEPAYSLFLPLGGSGSISVTATGPGLAYQWYNSSGALMNGANFLNANTSTLTITNAQAFDADSYYVIITSASGALGQSSNTVVLIGNTNIGPFSPTNWPGSLPTGTETVDYAIFDPNANFTIPQGWVNDVSLPASAGDQTWTTVTYDGLQGDAATGTYMNFAINPDWTRFASIPVIDVLLQVYGNSDFYNSTNGGLTLLWTEGGGVNVYYYPPYETNPAAVNPATFPYGLNNQQWNWMLLEVTNPLVSPGVRDVGNPAVATNSGGEYGGVNNGTLRLGIIGNNMSGIAIRTIAIGAQGVFGSTAEINRFATPSNCPAEPADNLAWVDFNQGVTNHLTPNNDPAAGESYQIVSGVGPAGDLRTAMQCTSGIMEFPILSNYLGEPCNENLVMQLCMEVYDDPNLAGSMFGPYQYATDPQGDVANYNGSLYTLTGSGQWIKVAFYLGPANLQGINTAPLTGGPSVEFYANAPYVDRVELGVIRTGTNALAGQIPDPSYYIAPLVTCSSNYGYYGEWFPSAGITNYVNVSPGSTITLAGPANNQRIAEVPTYAAGSGYYYYFSLLDNYFGPSLQDNLDIIVSFDYYDDPALAGAYIGPASYYTLSAGSVIFTDAPAGSSVMLQGTGRWVTAAFELPNVNLSAGVCRLTSGSLVYVSRVRYDVIRPCGPYLGIDYLQSLGVAFTNAQMQLGWRGTATVQGAPVLPGVWTSVDSVTNILTNAYLPAMTNRAEFYRLEFPAYPSFLSTNVP